MREELKERSGNRQRFIGTFAKYGLKSSYRGLPRITLLITDLKTVDGKYLCDHIWLNDSKGFKALGLLCPGDIIAFDARVGSYLKGYGGEEYGQHVDYHLTRPTKLVVLGMAAPRNIYNVCEKCGYANRINAERCRRCGAPFEEQSKTPEAPKIDPKLRQRTLEDEFNSIMKSIGVISKERKH